MGPGSLHRGVSARLQAVPAAHEVLGGSPGTAAARAATDHSDTPAETASPGPAAALHGAR